MRASFPAIAVFIISLVLVRPSIAQTPVGSKASAEPPVCIGYNPDTKSWGAIGEITTMSPEANCPDGWAFVAAEYVTGIRRPARNVTLAGTCCRMPAGMLTAEHIYMLDQCPDAYVATGAKPVMQIPRGECDRDIAKCTDQWRSSDHYMRCTRIDTSRFTLGPATPSLGIGWGRHYSSYFHPRTSRGRIPAGLRYALARKSENEWGDGSCIGYPYGSLLVAKLNKYCPGFLFRELQYTGAEGDPPQGTPVPVIPSCRAINSPWDPNAHCVE